MLKTTSLLIAILIVGLSGCAKNSCGLQNIDHPASHDESLEKFFEVSKFDTIFSTAIETSLKQQLELKPEIEPFLPTLRAFFEKYMSWESIKPEMAKLYKETFTKEEIDAMTDFYSTEAGAKALQKTPELMKHGMALGMKRFQENQNELKTMIEAEVAKQRAQSSDNGEPASNDGASPSN